MNQFNGDEFFHATTKPQNSIPEQIVDTIWKAVRPRFVQLIEEFLVSEFTPLEFFRFELTLLSLVRDLGRQLMEKTLNVSEDGHSQALPDQLWYENGGYRRLHGKTRNAHLSTLLIAWVRSLKHIGSTSRSRLCWPP